MSLPWKIEPAQPEDLPSIAVLLEAVNGDLEDLSAEQFLICRTLTGQVVGCGRLKPVAEGYELASLAVEEDWRKSGVGRALVAQLVAWQPGPIYLICEDDVVDFFRQFEFHLVHMSEMLTGLQSKWQRYVTQLGHINVMRRDTEQLVEVG